MSVPPFGIVGWASPITAAGVLCPGWGWAGLVATAAGLSAMTTRAWPLAGVAMGVAFSVSALTWSNPVPLDGWVGIDTAFNYQVAGEHADYAQHMTTIALVRRAVENGASTVVLPESALGIWTPTTERLWTRNLADLDVDWFHGNALAYDPTDDTILVSGRTQGLVKLTRANEVVWILAPHRAWRSDLAAKLLQPLDAAGVPITDAAVLDGAVPHPEFEWSWYQHAPAILADGSVALFDNGDNRGYQFPGTYSRAVVYRIDAKARTIQQVWEYGRERGAETFSRIVSDVDEHPEAGTILFAPGAVASPGGPVGRIVEVDRATRSVRFEATVRAPQVPFGITFHRVERLPLYPDL